MTTAPITVKRGDVGVIFDDTLTSDGEAIDLTDASVTFLLRPRSGAATTTIDAAAVILDEEAGTVRYVTVPGDLDTVGIYRQEWEIAWDSGDHFTVPSDGWNTVHVIADLNPDDGS